jgi:hypothetical protein
MKTPERKVPGLKVKVPRAFKMAGFAASGHVGMALAADHPFATDVPGVELGGTAGGGSRGQLNFEGSILQ